MKRNGISFNELMSSIQNQGPLNRGPIIGATIDAGIRLSFVTAAIALNPNMLRAAFEQIESDALAKFADSDPETIEALKLNFDNIKTTVFALNKLFFEE